MIDTFNYYNILLYQLRVSAFLVFVLLTILIYQHYHIILCYYGCYHYILSLLSCFIPKRLFVCLCFLFNHFILRHGILCFDIHICVYLFIYIYIYTYYLSMCIYIYIYTHMHMYYTALSALRPFYGRRWIPDRKHLQLQLQL